jgi:YggT family protein
MAAFLSTPLVLPRKFVPTQSSFLACSPCSSRIMNPRPHSTKLQRKYTQNMTMIDLHTTSTILETTSTLPSFLLSESPTWFPLAQFVCGPMLWLFNLLMLTRIPLSWFPKTEASIPWIYMVAITEPLLKTTRKVIPAQGGVDISPVVWLGIGLFLNEILNGPQGMLVLFQNK